MEENNNPTAGLIEETEYIPRIPKEDEFLMDDEWYDVDITNDWLDVTKEYTKPQYMFRINGVECFPLGGLQGITGQAGSGKTQTMSMLIAAALGDTKHNIEYCLKDEEDQPITNRRVLYVDTEMEEGNTLLVNRRVCAMLGWDPQTPLEKLKYLRLRDELTALDRWKKILKAIYVMGSDLRLVIVDGLIDVIGDFNDNKECQEVIFKTMAIAEHYKVALCLVLHQNPGTEKMVGHAGSFLERKATDIFQTKKDKDENTGDVTFTVSQKKARGEDVPDLKFRIVKSEDSQFGVAEVERLKTSDEIAEENNIITENIRSLIIDAYGDQSEMSTGDFEKAIRQSQKKLGYVAKKGSHYTIDNIKKVGIKSNFVATEPRERGAIYFVLKIDKF